ncbi:MAG: CsbD family protein [Pseudohongiellaceae bacterium]
MKRPNEQYTEDSESITQRNANYGSTKQKQRFPKSGQKPETQSDEKQDHKNDRNKRSGTLNDAEYTPMVAAEGDDDLMSKNQQPKKQQSHQQPQQQPQGMASGDEIKGKWKQQVGAAKVAWGKLTEDELLKSEGHAQKLSGLVQERYAVSRDEADRQVDAFMSSNK